MVGLAKNKENNALAKHKQFHHPDSTADFQFETENIFSDPASKQLFDKFFIKRSPSTLGFLMTSKAEYKQGEWPGEVILILCLAF